MCGYPPFNGDGETAIHKSILKGKFDFETEEWLQVSDDCKNLIKSMLTLDFNSRPSAQEVLKSDWFKLLNTPEAESKIINKTGAVLDSLANMKESSTMQKAIFSFISMHLASKEDLTELAKVFAKMDENGDGKLSKEEMLKGYKDIYPELSNPEELIDKIYKEYDTDGTGFLE